MVFGRFVPLDLVLSNIGECSDQSVDAIDVLLQAFLEPLPGLGLCEIRVKEHGQGVEHILRFALVCLRLGLDEPRLDVNALHHIGNRLILPVQSALDRIEQIDALKLTVRDPTDALTPYHPL